VNPLRHGAKLPDARGVDTEMANQAKPDAKSVRPLWLLANVLLTVAVCLLLVVIKNQLSNSHQETSALEPASENQPSAPTNPVGRKTPPITPRKIVKARRAAEAAQSPAVGEAVELASALPPAPPDRILPPAPGAAFPPVIAPAYTNFTTGIAGRVTLRGEPPPEEPIDISAFSPCAKLQTNSPTTRNFVVSPDGGLADVFVSIVLGLDRTQYPPPRTNHEIVFVNCQMQPYVSAMLAGQRLRFFDADPQAHTVRITPMKNPPFSLSLRSKSDGLSPPLRQPEEFVRLSCDLHAWESAYVSVVKPPFFAVTDTNGDFVIPNVPPGKYQVRALHRVAQGTNGMIREVVVRSDKISQVNFTFDAPGH
jgi:hypothetical protein